MSRSHRHYPVQQQGKDDYDRNATFDDREYIDLARQHARADRPLPMYPSHSAPRQLVPPPSRSFDESRVPVSNLINTPTSSTMHPYRDPQRDRSSSPADARSIDGPPDRLPSVNQLLAGHSNGMAMQRQGLEPSGAPQFVTPQYHRADNQDLPGLTTNHPGRSAGHSAASSLSSMYSEPTSPGSYNGHSYSPSPRQRYARAPHEIHAPNTTYARHDQFSSAAREDPAQMYHHQRSQPNIYPSPNGHPPLAAYTTYPSPYQAPYASQHQVPYPTQYQTPYQPAQPRTSMDHYGQMQRPGVPAQQALPEYAPLGPSAYPPGPSGMPQDVRNDSVLGTAYPTYGFPPHAYPPPRKRRGNLPKEATKVMKEWFAAHKDSPYPSEEQKQMLVSQTRLNMSQVNNWFINARRRQPRREAEDILERQRERGVTENSEDSLSNEIVNEYDMQGQRMPPGFGQRPPPPSHDQGFPGTHLAYRSRPDRPLNREQEEEDLRSNRRPGLLHA
ncbi:hypothetical protein FKW77_003326 [Venturia effusa]|uniref:Homeobox domain-containing protein n=1 Tax=Venturia effusa TaxID=50376 RepID=A0A517L113_9PEZI|nr:hypothetical protein FKW77_003326 [Venturia effusa]